MNRKALILYIRDLRDLEIAARRIEKLYQEEKKDYGAQLSPPKEIVISIPPGIQVWQPPAAVMC